MFETKPEKTTTTKNSQLNFSETTTEEKPFSLFKKTTTKYAVINHQNGIIKSNRNPKIMLSVPTPKHISILPKLDNDKYQDLSNYLLEGSSRKNNVKVMN